jgi:myosin heavy subunit
MYQLGNTKVFMVAPEITKDESQRRWERVCEVASMIIQNIMDREQE